MPNIDITFKIAGFDAAKNAVKDVSTSGEALEVRFKGLSKTAQEFISSSKKSFSDLKSSLAGVSSSVKDASDRISLVNKNMKTGFTATKNAIKDVEKSVSSLGGNLEKLAKISITTNESLKKLTKDTTSGLRSVVGSVDVVSDKITSLNRSTKMGFTSTKNVIKDVEKEVSSLGSKLNGLATISASSNEKLRKLVNETKSGFKGMKGSISEVVEAVNKLASTMSKMQMGKNIEVKGSTSELNKSLTATEGIVTSLSSKINKLEADFSALGKATPQTASAFDQLRSSITATVNPVDVLMKGINTLESEFNRLGKSNELTRSAFNQLRGSLTAIENPINALVGDIKKLESEFDRLGVSTPKTKEAFNQLREAVKAVNPAINDLRMGISSLEAAFSAAGLMNAKIRSALEELRSSLKETGKEAETTKKKFDFGAVFDKFKSSSQTFLNSLFNIRTVIATLGIGAAVKELYDMGLLMDRTTRAFTVITGSAELAQKELSFLKESAHGVGLSFYALLEPYKKFAASAMGTKIAGEDVRKVFTAVTSAGAALGLSNDELQGSFYALGQMMSKGKVQTEELRRQLSERFPGAWKIAAEAMGTTVSGLEKMITKGEIFAEEFMPKFARSLEKNFSEAAKENVDSAVGVLNLFIDAWKDLLATTGESGFMEAAMSTLKEITIELKNAGAWAKENKETIKDVFQGAYEATKVLVTGIAVLLEWFGKLTIGVGNLSAYLGLASGGMISFADIAIGKAKEIKEAYDLDPVIGRLKAQKNKIAQELLGLLPEGTLEVDVTSIIDKNDTDKVAELKKQLAAVNVELKNYYNSGIESAGITKEWSDRYDNLSGTLKSINKQIEELSKSKNVFGTKDELDQLKELAKGLSKELADVAEKAGKGISKVYDTIAEKGRGLEKGGFQPDTLEKYSKELTVMDRKLASLSVQYEKAATSTEDYNKKVLVEFIKRLEDMRKTISPTSKEIKEIDERLKTARETLVNLGSVDAGKSFKEFHKDFKKYGSEADALINKYSKKIEGGIVFDEKSAEIAIKELEALIIKYKGNKKAVAELTGYLNDFKIALKLIKTEESIKYLEGLDKEFEALKESMDTVEKEVLKRTKKTYEWTPFTISKEKLAEDIASLKALMNQVQYGSDTWRKYNSQLKEGEENLETLREQELEYVSGIDFDDRLSNLKEYYDQWLKDETLNAEQRKNIQAKYFEEVRKLQDEQHDQLMKSGDDFSDMWKGMVSGFEKAVRDMKMTWAEFGDKIGEDFVSNFSELTRDVVGNLYDALSGEMTFKSEFEDDLSDIQDELDSLYADKSKYQFTVTLFESMGIETGDVYDQALSKLDEINEKISEQKELYDEVAAEAEEAFEDVWDAIGDSFDSFADRMVESFLDAIATMAAQAAAAEIVSYISGETTTSGGSSSTLGGAAVAVAGSAVSWILDWVFGHSGGVVTDQHTQNVFGLDTDSRFTKSALKSDEVMAVLQTGEAVIPREDVKSIMYGEPYTKKDLEDLPRFHDGGILTPFTTLLGIEDGSIILDSTPINYDEWYSILSGDITTNTSIEGDAYYTDEQYDALANVIVGEVEKSLLDQASSDPSFSFSGFSDLGYLSSTETVSDALKNGSLNIAAVALDAIGTVLSNPEASVTDIVDAALNAMAETGLVGALSGGIVGAIQDGLALDDLSSGVGARLGGVVGSVLGGPVGGILGAVGGSILGDAIADAFDAREYETYLDEIEELDDMSYGGQNAVKSEIIDYLNEVYDKKSMYDPWTIEAFMSLLPSKIEDWKEEYSSIGGWDSVVKGVEDFIQNIKDYPENLAEAVETSVEFTKDLWDAWTEAIATGNWGKYTTLASGQVNSTTSTVGTTTTTTVSGNGTTYTVEYDSETGTTSINGVSITDEEVEALSDFYGYGEGAGSTESGGWGEGLAEGVDYYSSGGSVKALEDVVVGEKGWEYFLPNGDIDRAMKIGLDGPETFTPQTAGEILSHEESLKLDQMEGYAAGTATLLPIPGPTGDPASDMAGMEDYVATRFGEAINIFGQKWADVFNVMDIEQKLDLLSQASDNELWGEVLSSAGEAIYQFKNTWADAVISGIQKLDTITTNKIGEALTGLQFEGVDPTVFISEMKPELQKAQENILSAWNEAMALNIEQISKSPELMGLFYTSTALPEGFADVGPALEGIDFDQTSAQGIMQVVETISDAAKAVANLSQVSYSGIEAVDLFNLMTTEIQEAVWELADSVDAETFASDVETFKGMLEDAGQAFVDFNNIFWTALSTGFENVTEVDISNLEDIMSQIDLSGLDPEKVVAASGVKDALQAVADTWVAEWTGTDWYQFFGADVQAAIAVFDEIDWSVLSADEMISAFTEMANAADVMGEIMTDVAELEKVFDIDKLLAIVEETNAAAQAAAEEAGEEFTPQTLDWESLMVMLGVWQDAQDEVDKMLGVFNELDSQIEDTTDWFESMYTQFESMGVADEALDSFMAKLDEVIIKLQEDYWGEIVDNFKDAVDEYVYTGSNLEQEYSALEEELQGYIDALVDSGYTTIEMVEFEEAKNEALQGLLDEYAQKVEDTVNEVKDYFAEISGIDLGETLTDKIDELNEYFDEQVEALKELSAAESDIAEIEAMRVEALEALAEAEMDTVLGLQAAAVGLSEAFNLLQVAERYQFDPGLLDTEGFNYYEIFQRSMDFITGSSEEILAFSEKTGISVEQIMEDAQYLSEAVVALVEPFTDIDDAIKEWSATIEGFSVKEQLTATIAEWRAARGYSEDFLDTSGMLYDDLVEYSELLADSMGIYLEDLQDTYSRFEDAGSEAQDLSDYINTVLGEQTSVMDEIPTLLSTGIDDVENYIDALSDWAKEAAGLYEEYGAFIDSINESIADITEGRTLEGLDAQGQFDYYTGQISTGFADIESGAMTPEAELEAAQELYDVIMERYSVEEELVDEITDRIEDLRDVIADIKGKIEDLYYSSYNLAVNTEKAQAASVDYSDKLAAAQEGLAAGDTEAVNEYLSFIDTFLATSQEAYKSSGTYQEIYDTVMADLEALGLQAEDVMTAEELALDNINNTLIDGFESTVSALNYLATLMGGDQEEIGVELESQNEVLESLLGDSGSINTSLQEIKNEITTLLSDSGPLGEGIEALIDILNYGTGTVDEQIKEGMDEIVQGPAYLSSDEFKALWNDFFANAQVGQEYMAVGGGTVTIDEAGIATITSAITGESQQFTQETDPYELYKVFDEMAAGLDAMFTTETPDFMFGKEIMGMWNDFFSSAEVGKEYQALGGAGTITIDESGIATIVDALTGASTQLSQAEGPYSLYDLSDNFASLLEQYFGGDSAMVAGGGSETASEQVAQTVSESADTTQTAAETVTTQISTGTTEIVTQAQASTDSTALAIETAYNAIVGAINLLGVPLASIDANIASIMEGSNSTTESSTKIGPEIKEMMPYDQFESMANDFTSVKEMFAGMNEAFTGESGISVDVGSDLTTAMMGMFENITSLSDSFTGEAPLPVYMDFEPLLVAMTDFMAAKEEPVEEEEPPAINATFVIQLDGTEFVKFNQVKVIADSVTTLKARRGKLAENIY